MAVTPSEAPTAVAVERRRPGLALLVALVCWVPYAGLALPYYVNGVHRRAADQTIYAYDVGTIWPYDTALGVVVGFVTIVGVPTAPFVAAGVAMWSGLSVWAWWRTLTPQQVALYVAAVAVAVGSLAWLTTPLASELIMWFLD